jgi:hypothetical protein
MMPFQEIKFGQKDIFCGSFDDSVPDVIPQPFAVLFPAFNEEDRRKGMALVAHFLEKGCREFFCMGKEGEVMHDDMDDHLEKIGKKALTTFDDNRLGDDSLVSACEYFVLGAGRVNACLVALAGDYPVVVSHLKKFAAECEG